MNANLMTKKIEMSQKEAKEAGKLNTEKFTELRNYMAMYPGFEIQIKAPARRKVEFRGLDYKYMREYIRTHDKDGTIMAEFNTLTAKDSQNGAGYLEATSYLVVKEWFLKKFPEIKKYKEEHQQKIQKILNAA